MLLRRTEPLIRPFYQLLVNNCPPLGPGRLFLTNSETVEEAGQDLQGGLTTTLEGLGDSWPPCAAPLSVAGFLVSFAPFPAGRKVYSEERRGLLRAREASSLQGGGNNGH